MAGIGDLLGLAARAATQATLKNKGSVNKMVGSAIGHAVANAANSLLVKTKVQSEDGKLLLKLPFLKNVEEKTRSILAIHPDRKKVFFHMADSICDESVFYDIEGNAVYQINKSSKNLKHISLCSNNQFIGEIQKKTELIKNPLQDSDKYSITLHGNDLGHIIVGDRIIKTYAKPEFDSWEMTEKGFHAYEILDKDEKEIASIYYPGDSTYIIDCSNSFDLELLIMTFMAVQMRKEMNRKKIERERKMRSLTRPL